MEGRGGGGGGGKEPDILFSHLQLAPFHLLVIFNLMLQVGEIAKLLHVNVVLSLQLLLHLFVLIHVGRPGREIECTEREWSLL